MKKIKAAATHIGLGIGAVYAFFLIPDIHNQFNPQFITILRQGLIIGFAVCIFIDPTGLMKAGESFIPGVIKFLKLFISNKKDGEDNTA